MSEPKNIVLITPGFPSDESDHLCMPYVQTALKQMIESHKHLSITVIALQYPYSKTPYTWFGISVFPCGGNNRPFPAKLLYWRKALKHLSRLHKEYQVDVVHSLWLSECTYLAQRWTSKNNVKHIATAMGQDVLPTNKYLKRINLDKLGLIALSEFQNKKLIKTTGRVADKLIPFGLDAEPNAAGTKDVDILGVGSLIKLKDYRLFLHVVVATIKSKPDLKVVLVGDGPENAQLKALAKSLNIDGNVEFKGNLSRPKVLELMKRSKVFLHTSTFESQGYVFNEALANGMSIVSRNVGVAEASDRWLICAKEQEMADCIVSLLDRKFEPTTFFPVRHTIEEYENLYA